MKECEKEMDNILIDYNKYVGSYVNYEPTNGSCSISQDISGIDDATPQQFSTEDNIGWKIWDYDGETIRLISDKPTTTKLQLKGISGYNNGVWAINEICRKCYGKYDKNNNLERGIGITNLKRSDIQKVTKYNYLNCSHDDTGGTDKGENGKYKYGSTLNYKELIKYPNIWEEIDKGWSYEKNTDNSITNNKDKEGLTWEKEGNINQNIKNKTVENSDINFKNSYWYHNWGIDGEKDWINPKYYNLLFKDETETTFNACYWLSTREVYLTSSKVTFILCHIWTNPEKSICQLNGNNLYLINAENPELSGTLPVRPIVSINLTTSNYSLIKEEDPSSKTVSFKLSEKNV